MKRLAISAFRLTIVYRETIDRRSEMLYRQP
jgi:hypothetical protein